LLSEISLSETNLIVYSDGSLINKSSFTRTGASAVLYHQNAEVKYAQLGLGGRAEVYDGELAGLMIGAREALRYQKDNPTIKHLHFFANNSSAIRGIFNPNNKAGQHYTHRFHRKLCKFLDQNHNNRLTISWCPSHSDIKGNERADKLAKEATTLARDAPISTSRSNALRRAKLVSARTWRKQWEKSPKNRSFAIANRLQPSMNLTKRFRDNPREVFGCLIQCRTAHTYTGEYGRRFHLNDDHNCPCGEELQTRDHIIRDCTKFARKHDMLIRLSRDIFLLEILGTEEGIKALSTFLKDTSAFKAAGRQAAPKEAPRFEEQPNPPISDEEDDR
jgi:ribonuclease HI